MAIARGSDSGELSRTEVHRPGIAESGARPDSDGGECRADKSVVDSGSAGADELQSVPRRGADRLSDWHVTLGHDRCSCDNLFVYRAGGEHQWGRSSQYPYECHNATGSSDRTDGNPSEFEFNRDRMDSDHGSEQLHGGPRWHAGGDPSYERIHRYGARGQYFVYLHSGGEWGGWAGDVLESSVCHHAGRFWRIDPIQTRNQNIRERERALFAGLYPVQLQCHQGSGCQQQNQRSRYLPHLGESGGCHAGGLFRWIYGHREHHQLPEEFQSAL